ncbi:MAG TPA: hypothetical protein VFE62_09160 [Gemmataceae bacterium]|nr:hypothetical protein [Gemmataceae bacterium]
MNVFSRFFAWLLGRPTGPTYTKRSTIDGIELEKILVFAKGREATLQEMLTVISSSLFKIEGGGGSGFKCSTEEWNQLPGETETSAIQRVARETSDKFPGMFVVAFAWPDTYPTILAAIVTTTYYPTPFPAAPHTLITGIKRSERN